MLTRFIKNYIERHQHPANRWLHVVGLPLAFVAPVVCLWNGLSWWAIGCFLAGYALQFAGHAIEGNDAGEVVLLKKCMGQPYTAFGPRRRPPSAS